MLGSLITSPVVVSILSPLNNLSRFTFLCCFLVYARHCDNS